MAARKDWTDVIETGVSAAIAQSGTTSAAAITGLAPLVGFDTDANWTASNVTFERLCADGNYKAVIDPSTGSAYTLSAVPASKYNPVDPALFLGVTTLKVVAATTQTNATVVYLTTRLM